MQKRTVAHVIVVVAGRASLSTCNAAQNAGAVSAELYAGTVPSSCEGGIIEVGDFDISLGEMVVHSKRLTEVDVSSSAYSGPLPKFPRPRAPPKASLFG